MSQPIYSAIRACIVCGVVKRVYSDQHPVPDVTCDECKRMQAKIKKSNRKKS